MKEALEEFIGIQIPESLEVDEELLQEIKKKLAEKYPTEDEELKSVIEFIPSFLLDENNFKESVQNIRLLMKKLQDENLEEPLKTNLGKIQYEVFLQFFFDVLRKPPAEISEEIQSLIGEIILRCQKKDWSTKADIGNSELHNLIKEIFKSHKTLDDFKKYAEILALLSTIDKGGSKILVTTINAIHSHNKSLESDVIQFFKSLPYLKTNEEYSKTLLHLEAEIIFAQNESITLKQGIRLIAERRKEYDLEIDHENSLRIVGQFKELINSKKIDPIFNYGTQKDLEDFIFFVIFYQTALGIEKSDIDNFCELLCNQESDIAKSLLRFIGQIGETLYKPNPKGLKLRLKFLKILLDGNKEKTNQTAFKQFEESATFLEKEFITREVDSRINLQTLVTLETKFLTLFQYTNLQIKRSETEKRLILETNIALFAKYLLFKLQILNLDSTNSEIIDAVRSILERDLNIEEITDNREEITHRRKHILQLIKNEEFPNLKTNIQNICKGLISGQKSTDDYALCISSIALCFITFDKNSQSFPFDLADIFIAELFKKYHNQPDLLKEALNKLNQALLKNKAKIEQHIKGFVQKFSSRINSVIWECDVYLEDKPSILKALAYFRSPRKHNSPELVNNTLAKMIRIFADIDESHPQFPVIHNQMLTNPEFCHFFLIHQKEFQPEILKSVLTKTTENNIEEIFQLTLHFNNKPQDQEVKIRNLLINSQIIQFLREKNKTELLAKFCNMSFQLAVDFKASSSQQQSDQKDLEQELLNQLEAQQQANLKLRLELEAAKEAAKKAEKEVESQKSQIELLLAEGPKKPDTKDKTAKTTEAELRAEISRLTQQNQQLKEAQQQSAQIIEKLQEAQRNAQSELDRKSNKIENLTAELANKQEALEAQVEKFTNEFANQKTASEKFIAELALKQQEIARLKSDLLEARQDLATSEKKLQTSQKELKIYEQELAAAKQELQNSLAVIQPLESEQTQITKPKELFSNDNVSKLLPEIVEEVLSEVKTEFGDVVDVLRGGLLAKQIGFHTLGVFGSTAYLPVLSRVSPQIKSGKKAQPNLDLFLVLDEDNQKTFADLKSIRSIFPNASNIEIHKSRDEQSIGIKFEFHGRRIALNIYNPISFVQYNGFLSNADRIQLALMPDKEWQFVVNTRDQLVSNHITIEKFISGLQSGEIDMFDLNPKVKILELINNDRIRLQIPATAIDSKTQIGSKLYDEIFKTIRKSDGEGVLIMNLDTFKELHCQKLLQRAAQGDENSAYNLALITCVYNTAKVAALENVAAGYQDANSALYNQNVALLFDRFTTPLILQAATQPDPANSIELPKSPSISAQPTSFESLTRKQLEQARGQV